MKGKKFLFAFVLPPRLSLHHYLRASVVIALYATVLTRLRQFTISNLLFEKTYICVSIKVLTFTMSFIGADTKSRNEFDAPTCITVSYHRFLFLLGFVIALS